jgi:hypothetical protein
VLSGNPPRLLHDPRARASAPPSFRIDLLKRLHREVQALLALVAAGTVAVGHSDNDTPRLDQLHATARRTRSGSSPMNGARAVGRDGLHLTRLGEVGRTQGSFDGLFLMASRAVFHARWTTQERERSSRRASDAISSSICSGKYKLCLRLSWLAPSSSVIWEMIHGDRIGFTAWLVGGVRDRRADAHERGEGEHPLGADGGGGGLWCGWRARVYSRIGRGKLPDFLPGRLPCSLNHHWLSLVERPREDYGYGGYRLSDDGNPNHPSTLCSKRVIAQIRSLMHQTERI